MQVITIWFEVQRTWSHLESIFIGDQKTSEDNYQKILKDLIRLIQTSR